MKLQSESGLRVAVVHDYATQRGGAERVALQLLEVFGWPDFYCNFYDASSTYAEFAKAQPRASRAQKMGWLRRDPRKALPILPWLTERLVPEKYDLLVCSSSGFAHGARGGTRKVIYCHNPPRWLYQTHSYTLGWSRKKKALLWLILPLLRRWDKRAARSSTTYVANSRAVAKRIFDTYGLRAEVINPPPGLVVEGQQTPVAGLKPGFYLTVGRARAYKHTDAVLQAFGGDDERIVVWAGAGESRSDLSGRGSVVISSATDAEMRWLYANCRGLISCSEEDFGLTPLEAFSFGKPAILLKFGGHLETQLEGVTGLFVDEPTADAVKSALDNFETSIWHPDVIKAHAQSWQFSEFERRILEVAFKA